MRKHGARWASDLSPFTDWWVFVRGFVEWARSLKNTEDILYCWDDPKPGIVAIFAAGMKQWRMRNVPRWVNQDGEISRPVLRPYS